MDDLISRQAALEKVRAMQTYKLFMGDDMILVDKAEVQTELMMLPSVQPEVLACGNGELVAQPEPTYEQVEEYCKKRCLHVVTDDFFESTKPQRLGHWVDGRCNECGGQAPFWVMASTYYESDFCPHCGAKMTISTK